MGKMTMDPPALAGNSVYAACFDGHAYAIDATSGRERWRFKAAITDDGEPTRVDVASMGTVLVQTVDEGNVFALDADSGRLRWSRSTGLWLGSPAGTATGLVCVAGRDRKRERAVTILLDEATGDERWRYEADDLRAMHAPLFHGDSIVVSGSGVVFSLHAEDGTLEWRFDTGGQSSTRFAVSESTLFFKGEYRRHKEAVYAVDAADGQLRWRYPTPFSGIYAPAVGQGAVYVFAYDSGLHREPGAVIAIEEHSGRARWWYPKSGDPPFPPVTTGGLVLTCNSLHEYSIIALFMDSGEEAWRLPIPFRPLIRPAVRNRVMYSTDHGGGVNAVQLPDPFRDLQESVPH
jgi:outer membrane protein assembly factor BamB